MLSDHLHREYAKSPSAFGTTRQLQQYGGWILERQMAGFRCRDALGCYLLPAHTII